MNRGEKTTSLHPPLRDPFFRSSSVVIRPSSPVSSLQSQVSSLSSPVCRLIFRLFLLPHPPSHSILPPMPIRFKPRMLTDPLAGPARLCRPSAPHARTPAARFPAAPKSVRRRPAAMRPSDAGITKELSQSLPAQTAPSRDLERHQNKTAKRPLSMSTAKAMPPLKQQKLGLTGNALRLALARCWCWEPEMSKMLHA
jgi:hypothetical protein